MSRDVLDKRKNNEKTGEGVDEEGNESSMDDE